MKDATGPRRICPVRAGRVMDNNSLLQGLG